MERVEGRGGFCPGINLVHRNVSPNKPVDFQCLGEKKKVKKHRKTNTPPTKQNLTEM